MTAESDEARLLAAVAAGDREALRILYESHAGRLTPRLSRRCGVEFGGMLAVTLAAAAPARAHERHPTTQ